MVEFLQSYGVLILVGLFLLLVLRFHGGAMGCCGHGHGGHHADPTQQQRKEVDKPMQTREGDL